MCILVTERPMVLLDQPELVEYLSRRIEELFPMQMGCIGYIHSGIPIGSTPECGPGSTGIPKIFQTLLTTCRACWVVEKS